MKEKKVNGCVEGREKNSDRNTAEMTCFAKTNLRHPWDKFWLSLKSKKEAVFGNSDLKWHIKLKQKRV